MVEALIVYDVNTVSQTGARRLRQVAKACEGLGHRVQKSVFEVECSRAQLIQLTARLRGIIDAEDSIRIYRCERGTFDAVQQLGCVMPSRIRGGVVL